jgi:hypothetical protein
MVGASSFCTTNNDFTSAYHLQDVSTINSRKYMTFFLLTGLLALPIALFGQKSEKQFGFGTGWYHQGFNDPTVSTSTNTGSSVSVHLFFRSNGKNSIHRLQLLYAAPSLNSTYLLTREQTIYLQYAYHRKIGTMKNKIQFYGGVVFDINGSYLRYSEMGNSYSYLYPFNWIESIGSLGSSVLIEVPFEKNKISLQAWISLVGYVFGGARSQRGWVGIGDFSNLNSRISYSRYFSDRWEGRIDYQWQLYTLAKYENLSSVVHQVNFSLVYKFY